MKHSSYKSVMRILQRIIDYSRETFNKGRSTGSFSAECQFHVVSFAVKHMIVVGFDVNNTVGHIINEGYIDPSVINEQYK